MYFTIGTAINVDGKWFLPFEQYELIDRIQVPMVAHITRGGRKFLPTHHLHEHVVVQREEDVHTLPIDAGTITEYEIPKAYVNRHILNEKRRSDNITDYVKAAEEHLNIEIRYQAEYAKWYTAQFRNDIK